MNDCRPLGSFVPLVAACLATACSSAWFVADADAEVAHALRAADEATLAGREETVLQPELAPAPPPPAPDRPPDQPAPEPDEKPEPKLPGEPPRRFDLREALAQAVQYSREFQTRREGLYESGLSITLARFQFGPQFTSAVNYLWSKNEAGNESHRAGGTVQASQILPTGGNLAVNAGLDAQWPVGPGSGDPVYGSVAGISLTQPLLRGAGYDIAWEPLTQAERSFTYAIRDFELFREEFSITIARQYFNLVSQRRQLKNEDANYDNAVFDRRKAEALQLVGRNEEKDVFLARRREIEAKDQLLDARANYDRAVDAFRVVLGLPTTVTIEIADEDPKYDPVRYTVESAIACARANRLDLITQRMSVEDSERAVRIAENALLPDLSLTANFGVTGSSTDLGHAAPDEWNAAVGVSMEIPLQRKAQRNAYRSSLISLEQSRRALQLREDELDALIQDALRQLRTIEERIALQQGQILTERRGVAVLEIRYESGVASNRDLFDARQGLVNAQNTLITLQVDHFIARLRLLKEMGILFVDAQGMWK
jgi:outer membrane protein TolC